MPERIGHKRERLLIQKPIPTVDAEGQPVPTWMEQARVWARATYLSGRELEAAQKINTDIVVRFITNYRGDITETMRVVWRNEFWNIHFIQPTEDKFDMSLMVGKVE